MHDFSIIFPQQQSPPTINQFSDKKAETKKKLFFWLDFIRQDVCYLSPNSQNQYLNVTPLPPPQQQINRNVEKRQDKSGNESFSMFLSIN